MAGEEGTALVVSGCSVLGPAIAERLGDDGWAVDQRPAGFTPSRDQRPGAVVGVAKPLRYDVDVEPLDRAVEELAEWRAFGQAVLSLPTAGPLVLVAGPVPGPGRSAPRAERW